MTRSDVVAAAAAIADRHGLEQVTLAAVAESVGVRSPSLYAHVDGLDGLRRLLALHAAQAFARALRAAARDRSGIDALRALAHRYRRFARRRPGLYAAAQRAVRPGEDDELYTALGSVIVPVLDALTRAGVPAAEQIHVTRAIRSALHGFVELEQGGGFGRPEAVDASFERLVDLLMTGVRAAASVA